MGVTWRGLEAHERELEQFPADVDQQALTILTNTVDRATNEIRVTYPVRTGFLRDSLSSRPGHSWLRPSIVVENAAWYAIPFEYGHQTRQIEGDAAGGQPAGRVFVPIALRTKRTLKGALVAMLKGFGAARVSDARG